MLQVWRTGDSYEVIPPGDTDDRFQPTAAGAAPAAANRNDDCPFQPRKIGAVMDRKKRSWSSWKGLLSFMRSPASPERPKGGLANIGGKEPSVYTVLQRVSAVLGLLAIAPLTHIWDRSWWMRLLFVLVAVALLAATTHDLLPRWARRGPVAVGVLLAIVIVATVVPGVHGRKRGPGPETAGRATIVSPRNGQLEALTLREASGYTDGFVATGTCELPRGYRAVLVSRADNGSGYWLLSDGIIGDCPDDGVSHRWTASRVDPSWAGMRSNRPVTLGVIILRRDLAEQAQIQKTKGEPIALSPPAASVLILVSRVQQS